MAPTPPKTRFSASLGVVLCTTALPSAFAQPTDYTDLGTHVVTESFSAPVHLDSATDVQWFRIELPSVLHTDGFVDIWTAHTSPSVPLTDIFMADVVLYDNQGTLRANETNVGAYGGAVITLGSTDPRPPECFVGADEELYCGERSFDGFHGTLLAGVWWLAVGQPTLDYASSDWLVVGTSSGLGRNIVLNFRIQPAGQPYCDGDFDWDGNVDQEDVRYLVNILGGGFNETGRWADYNRDGNEDQDDVLALIHTIAGGGCP